MFRKSLFALLLLMACANPFSQFYRGQLDARRIPFYEPSSGPLEIYRSDNLQMDSLALFRKGYVVCGSSFFNTGATTRIDSQLREHATRIGAQAVLVYSRHTGTVNGVIPMSTPETTTSTSSGTATAYGPGGMATAYGTGTTTTTTNRTTYLPYSIERFDFGAVFFVRVTPRFGIFPEALDNDTRIRLGTNAGVRVLAIVDGSPAYRSDILPGDIILAINGDRVESVDWLLAALDRYEGQEIVCDIDRQGTRLQKTSRVLHLGSSLPPPTSPSLGGCTFDGECKGDRICVDGRCHDP